MNDLVTLVEDLSHRLAADGTGVAHLSASSGVECGAVKHNLVPVDGDDVCLELERVAVVPEDLVCHVDRLLYDRPIRTVR